MILEKQLGEPWPSRLDWDEQGEKFVSLSLVGGFEGLNVRSHVTDTGLLACGYTLAFRLG